MTIHRQHVVPVRKVILVRDYIDVKSFKLQDPRQGEHLMCCSSQ